MFLPRGIDLFEGVFNGSFVRVYNKVFLMSGLCIVEGRRCEMMIATLLRVYSDKLHSFEVLLYCVRKNL